MFEALVNPVKIMLMRNLLDIPYYEKYFLNSQ